MKIMVGGGRETGRKGEGKVVGQLQAVHMYVCMYVCMYMCVCVCVYVYVCVCMYIRKFFLFIYLFTACPVTFSNATCLM